MIQPKNRLKIILAEKEISGRELSRLIGVSDNTIYTWLSNKKLISTRNLYKIANAIDIPLCSILVNANKKPSEIEASNN